MLLDLTDDDVDLIVSALEALAETMEEDGDPCFEEELDKINALYSKIAKESRRTENV